MGPRWDVERQGWQEVCRNCKGPGPCHRGKLGAQQGPGRSWDGLWVWTKARGGAEVPADAGGTARPTALPPREWGTQRTAPEPLANGGGRDTSSGWRAWGPAVPRGTSTSALSGSSGGSGSRAALGLTSRWSDPLWCASCTRACWHILLESACLKEVYAYFTEKACVFSLSHLESPLFTLRCGRK